MLRQDQIVEIRLARQTDLSALYEVCLLTGDSGKSAAHIYQNRDLLGEIYVGPYVVLAPATAYVLADDSDIAVGYVLGALNTLEFESLRKSQWLPTLQEKYQVAFNNRDSNKLTPDFELMNEIFNPSAPPTTILSEFPSHGHIDLHPDYQGKGYGPVMMDKLISSLRSLGSIGLYLPVSSHNHNALGFYRKLGFEFLLERGDETIIGLKL